MLRAAVAALACLSVARSSPEYSLRVAHTPTTHNPKDITSILNSIEERLRVLDIVNAAQAKQARRLDIIQDKLDRVETTLTIKLERAQLAADRLEHRLHMIQTNIQVTIKESSEKFERSQMKIAELTRNLTGHIVEHKNLLEKVNGAYTDTWHRSLVLESLMRDGLSLINATRRELADGLRALGRRQYARSNSYDLEVSLMSKLEENAKKIEIKMQQLLQAQRNYVESCQQLQQDGPAQMTDILDRLIDSLIKITSTTFQELHKLQNKIDKHDDKIVTLLSASQGSQETTTPAPNTPAPKSNRRFEESQNDAACRRMEIAFRNTSYTALKENELRQLTEKFVALTDRADAALLKLEAHLKVFSDSPTVSGHDDADLLLQKLENTKNEESFEDFDREDNSGYFDDSGDDVFGDDDDDDTFDGDDMMGGDRQILRGKRRKTTTTTHAPHRRHLHKHPYDRGPNVY